MRRVISVKAPFQFSRTRRQPLNTMTYYNQDDSWNTSFHNVGLMCGERMNRDAVAQATLNICGIGPTDYRVQQLIGQWLSVSGRRCLPSAAGVNAVPEVRRQTNHRSRRCSGQRKRQQEPRSKFQFVHWSPTGPEGAIANCSNAPQYNYPLHHGIPGRRTHSTLHGVGPTWRVGR